jgi:hypothetical protein
MSTAVNDVLSLWREAERVLESLPLPHPDHASVQLMVHRLNETYQLLTDRRRDAENGVAEGEALIQQARTLLASVDAKTRPPER